MRSDVADLIIDSILFFETADDDAVDPDLAVQQLEALAHGLQNLPAEEQRDFLARATARAANGAHSDVLLKLPDALGLS